MVETRAAWKALTLVRQSGPFLSRFGRGSREGGGVRAFQAKPPLKNTQGYSLPPSSSANLARSKVTFALPASSRVRFPAGSEVLVVSP